MLPRDQFDRRYDALVAALTAFAEQLRDVADVTIERSTTFWRLRLDPKAAAPAPAELILHRNQTYDVMIGSEVYEALDLGGMDAIEPLLRAIVAGDVRTATSRSAATGRICDVTTIAGPAEAPLFQRTRRLTEPTGAVVTSVRHYPPYRR